MAKALTLNLYYDQSPKAGALPPATFANGQLVYISGAHLSYEDGTLTDCKSLFKELAQQDCWPLIRPSFFVTDLFALIYSSLVPKKLHLTSLWKRAVITCYSFNFWSLF